MALGPKVITRAIQAAGAAAPALGTAYIVGETDEGPEAPTLCRSLGEYVSFYGPRSATSAQTYDWANLFFALQGRRLYVSRVVNVAAHAAELTLNDAGAKPTLLVTFASKGVAGNTYKVEVKTVESTRREIRLLNEAGELIENNPPLTTQAAIIEWWATHTSYILVTASTAAEHTTNVPAERAATALAGGVNSSAPTDTERGTALNRFTPELGPGFCAMPGSTSEAAHLALAEHASTHGRLAWGDLAGAATATAVLAEANKASLGVGLQPYIRFTSGPVNMAGIVPGTTRTVKGSAAALGLCAQLANTNNMNRAPAGMNWPVAPIVTGFPHTFTNEEMTQLVEGGVNPWAERQGVLCLYGWVSAISREVDEVFWSAAAGAERMALAYEGLAIMEAFNFDTISGISLTAMKGELQELGKHHYESHALFGESPQEAFYVNTGEPPNTLAAEQKGEVTAELEARISSYIQSSTLIVISRAITEAVTVGE